MSLDPTQRFSDRVENYVRYRPGYPPTLLTYLENEAGLSRGQTIADVGSGTGKLTEIFLQQGYSVIGIEPNDEMRLAAERLFQHFSSPQPEPRAKSNPGAPGARADSPHNKPEPRASARAIAGKEAVLGALNPRPSPGEGRVRGESPAVFQSVKGSAEATGLPPKSVDCILVAQAFHWFDPVKTRVEFARILKPEGFVALIWNNRSFDATPFLKELEVMLWRHCPEYPKIGHRDCDPVKIGAFFAPCKFGQASFPNSQTLDWDALRGRMLSASYVPTSGPVHDILMRDLDAAFHRHAIHGHVVIAYATQLFWGNLT